MDITFTYPSYLWLLISIPILIFLHFFSLKNTKRRALKFANFDAIARITGEEILSKNIFLLFIRVITLLLVVFAAAGMVFWYEGLSSEHDVVLAIDASQSMLADDFVPNRLEAAKEAALLFVDSVPGEMSIGVVSFSGASLIESEVTNDLNKVRSSIENITAQGIGGTDLGQAMISSSNLLVSEKRPKVIILLTDGRSNVGIGPAEAVNYLNKDQIMVYTIGMGTLEGGEFIEESDIVSILDEEMLMDIANATDAVYYRAGDEESLKEAFKDIAFSNKKKLSKNISFLLMIIAFVFLLIEWTLINTKYKILP
ncbi:MAG: VWA domain-containing protein [Nanoarchaeota archaeon]|nr:VWA domain-containing protein [Nanoarchaeota archaeon]